MGDLYPLLLSFIYWSAVEVKSQGLINFEQLHGYGQYEVGFFTGPLKITTTILNFFIPQFPQLQTIFLFYLNKICSCMRPNRYQLRVFGIIKPFLECDFEIFQCPNLTIVFRLTVAEDGPLHSGHTVQTVMGPVAPNERDWWVSSCTLSLQPAYGRHVTLTPVVETTQNMWEQTVGFDFD